jgi:hypothetical protein
MNGMGGKVLVMRKWSDNGMKDTAVSWYRTPGQGSVFYTNFAKEDVDLDEATIGQKHILLDLRWTLRLWPSRAGSRGEGAATLPRPSS